MLFGIILAPKSHPKIDTILFDFLMIFSRFLKPKRAQNEAKMH